MRRTWIGLLLALLTIAALSPQATAAAPRWTGYFNGSYDVHTTVLKSRNLPDRPKGQTFEYDWFMFSKCRDGNCVASLKRGFGDEENPQYATYKLKPSKGSYVATRDTTYDCYVKHGKKYRTLKRGLHVHESVTVTVKHQDSDRVETFGGIIEHTETPTAAAKRQGCVVYYVKYKVAGKYQQTST